MNSTSTDLLQWRFSQVFGERSPDEELQDVDIISSIEFDKTGDHLAVGDRGGRVVIFERNETKDTHYHSRKEMERLDFISSEDPTYHYRTEFQSHEPEFDYLKSLEIEEKINRVRWCTTPNGSQLLLSTNDKTVKLWKVKEQKLRKAAEKHTNPFMSPENVLLAERSFISVQDELSVANGHRLEWTEKIAKDTLPNQEVQTQMAAFEDSARTKCRKVYAHAHDFNINSISTNSDGETFISADDLRINLWNLEISDQCFNIIDIKPSNMEDLTEVITSAEFHPVQCNLLAYSSSRGFIHLVDMRQSAVCDHSARILQDAECNGPKSFFTEIIASISDVKFMNDGRHILSRDYMNLKLWDMHMDSTPVATFKVHEYLRPKLCDLYNNDSIFDKFECCVSGDGLHFATGSYRNLVRIFPHSGGSEEGMTLEASKNPIRKSTNLVGSRNRRSSLSNLTRGFYRQGNEVLSRSDNDLSCSLNSKLLHLAWHPTTNLIACASGNSLFMFCA
ncbi:serine/threonine protein phosphatase 2A 55 kDa regulatory subunit B beta isoform-like [Rutidosis leptorrhynchoides]|uniref:serine/threonine protein phosphatase 2A 55 kDa regulatory subunit B beta isoform-like n=1 Tax=Rutidosis leptorrhynchoides TaxID=125765 RepID=UPI003A99DAFB